MQLERTPVSNDDLLSRHSDPNDPQIRLGGRDEESRCAYPQATFPSDPEDRLSGRDSEIRHVAPSIELRYLDWIVLRTNT